MIQLNASPVVFTEDPHEYHLGDKLLSGITSLIHNALGLGGYEDTSYWTRGFLVPRAAEYGKAVHCAIELYDKVGIKRDRFYKSERFRNGPLDNEWIVDAELENYIKHQEGFTAVDNEYVVSDNERYASCIDNIWSAPDGSIWLIDTKTNNLRYYEGGLDALKEYLSWQLSVYAYLFEKQNPHLKVAKLACNWLRKDEHDFFMIERKPDELVALLLQVKWVLNGSQIVFDLTTVPEALKKKEAAVVPQPTRQLVTADVIQAIVDVETQLKEAKQRSDELRAELRKAMENAGIKSWNSGEFKATIGASCISFTFDTKRFKEEHPDLYEQYCKPVQKSGAFIIKIKE